MKKSILFALFCCAVTLVAAQDYKFGKVSKEELKEKFYPLDSTAKAAYLFKKKNIYYEYDGESGWTIVTDVHERIKLYSKKGESAAKKSIKLFRRGGVDEKVTGLKAYTYNLEGDKIKKEKLNRKSRFTEKTNKNWSSEIFTMPNLQDGTVVEWSYKKISPFHYYIDDISFQHFIPIKKIDIRLRIPEYFMFQKHYKGYLSMYFKESKKNRKITYSYRQKDSDRSATTTKYSERVDLAEHVLQLNNDSIPALKEGEPYISNIQNYIGGVKFELNKISFPGSRPTYYTTTWEDVSKKIYKAKKFGGELSKSNYFKDDLKTILSAAKSNSQKIGAIFEFVKSKVKWNGSYGKYAAVGVKKAYSNGAGNVADVNLILVAMLRAAGLEANPVLVSTRNNDSGVLNVPTIDGFNYVIASVSLGKGFVVLDATETYSEPNVLPIRAVTRQGRVVYKGGNSVWLNLMPQKPSLEENNLYVNFDSEFNAKGMLRTRYTKLLALNYRNSKNHLKEEGIVSKLEEDFKVEIEDYKVLNERLIGKPVVRNVKFIADEFTEAVGGKVYINPLSFLSLGVNPFKLEERKFPVDFGVPFKNKTSVSIQIPEGYKVESLPESSAAAISDNMAVFGYKVISKGNKISVIYQLQINSPVISPEYYKELKELYNQVVKKHREKIVLVKQ
jgi:hypothetical protein